MENWSEIYDISDVDLANDFLETRVVNILDDLCPYKTIQYRKECKTWLKDDTKEKNDWERQYQRACQNNE